MEVEGLLPMKEYICRRQATIAEYITNRLIHELCIGVEKVLLFSIFMRWWYQDLNPKEEVNSSSKGAER